MLRTADDVIEALRARKDALGLSNATLDELAGTTDGHWDKACGPARVRTPTLFTLMTLAGALGLAVQFVDDPDAKVARRWQKRRGEYVRPEGRISKAAVRKARPLVLAELARKGGVTWWSNKTPEERRAHIARLNKARAAKRQASLKKAA